MLAGQPKKSWTLKMRNPSPGPLTRATGPREPTPGGHRLAQWVSAGGAAILSATLGATGALQDATP
jgi:hypothetical protein